jgi:predicted O-linked N-acetylglucosamine transferase (SPINDLY family)
MFEQALELHGQHRNEEALALCRNVVRLQSRHGGAWHLSGVIELQTNHPERAAATLGKAIALGPPTAAVYINHGIALHALGRFEDAVKSYDAALGLEPARADAHYNRGNALHRSGRNEAAIASYDQAILMRPDYAEAHHNRGNAVRASGDATASIASYDAALALRPHHAEAYNNRGNAWFELERFDAAVADYERAIAIAPGHAGAHTNLANALHKLLRFDAAIAAADRAIALRPDHADAYFSRGISLHALRRHEAAIASFDRAIALDPAHADAYNNRGTSLYALGQYEAAVAAYDAAVAIRPDHTQAYGNRGNALRDLKRFSAAVASYDRAIELKSGFRGLHGMRLNAKMQVCEWHGFDADLALLRASIEAGEPASPPFPVLIYSDSPALQKQAALNWVRAEPQPSPALPPILERPPRKDIRIGYFSADFHDHATAYLMSGLLEMHDKARFRLTAFSFGPDSAGPMRRRIEAASEFIDVRHLTDAGIAMLAREREIDIAVDLKGFTRDGRPGIFAERAAPLQVSYLGYPGTTGMAGMDYLVADRTMIPPGDAGHYTEQIIYLPDSYQVNDASRVLPEPTLSRPELGLPEAGFVYCCFNNNFKITPATFDVWMRILARVEHSVLWLLEDNPQAAANLREAAVQRGISAERLIFAPRMPLAAHLARHRAADLCLDTLPCNAHTTASDALWAGLPILTCAGATFAGRVAASLLLAIRLPELITSTAAQFEELAVALAANPERLGKLRHCLAENRRTAPLFDTKLYTERLETAYERIHARHVSGEPPAPLMLD